MKKLIITDPELTMLLKGLNAYRENLKCKIFELDECSNHFFVNEGLLNEVRIEKEKYSNELSILNEFIKKIKSEECNG